MSSDDKAMITNLYALVQEANDRMTRIEAALLQIAGSVGSTFLATGRSECKKLAAQVAETLKVAQ